MTAQIPLLLLLCLCSYPDAWTLARSFNWSKLVDCLGNSQFTQRLTKLGLIIAGLALYRGQEDGAVK